MGRDSRRKDWNFPAQSTNPYPLWAPGRGLVDEYDPNVQEYIFLIKDEFGGFHARWQRGTHDLPDPIRPIIESRDAGVWIQETS